jgi:hypothetical protein
MDKYELAQTKFRIWFSQLDGNMIFSLFERYVSLNAQNVLVHGLDNISALNKVLLKLPTSRFTVVCCKQVASAVKALYGENKNINVISDDAFNFQDYACAFDLVIYVVPLSCKEKLLTVPQYALKCLSKTIESRCICLNSRMLWWKCILTPNMHVPHIYAPYKVKTTFKQLGISIGQRLVWWNDASIICTVKNDENLVEYGNKVMTLTKLNNLIIVKNKIGIVNKCRTSVFGCWRIEGENDSLNVRRIKKTLVTVFSNC